MSVSSPAVMISSTFYDLRQIRADLATFIERDLGYRAVLSEHASFPVDPDIDTVENCRRRVEREADILVLIIGGRYGSVDEKTARSITNLEYLAAKAKGIPIYSFVETSILTLLPIWEKNPDADFSGSVADVRVFEFIRQVRSTDRGWTHDFELAGDIISALRMQFAHLFREAIHLRLQILGRKEGFPSHLSASASRLILEQPEAWEYLLFAQVLIDEVESQRDLRLEHSLGLNFGKGDHVLLEDVPLWAQGRLSEVNRIVNAMNIIIEQQLPVALNAPGVPGDPTAIAATARKLAGAYKHAIGWSQQVRQAHLPDCFAPVGVAMARFTDDMIYRIEEFGPMIMAQLQEALAAPRDGTPRVVNTVLTLELSNQEAFSAALKQAERDCYG